MCVCACVCGGGGGGDSVGVGFWASRAKPTNPISFLLPSHATTSLCVAVAGLGDVALAQIYAGPAGESHHGLWQLLANLSPPDLWQVLVLGGDALSRFVDWKDRGG